MLSLKFQLLRSILVVAVLRHSSAPFRYYVCLRHTLTETASDLTEQGAY